MLVIVIGFLGFAVTLMVGTVAYLAWRNGKVIRENTERMLPKIDEGFRMLGEKMDEGFRILGERMDEGFRMLGEKIDEGFRKMDRNNKLIALLILAETPEEKEAIAKRILEEE